MKKLIAAITLFAVVALGLGWVGYKQYIQDDYQNEVIELAQAMYQYADNCGPAGDPASSQDELEAALCKLADVQIKIKRPLASDKAELAGVSNDRHMATIEVEYWTAAVADKCRSVQIILSGSLVCGTARLQLDNAKAALSAQSS